VLLCVSVSFTAFVSESNVNCMTSRASDLFLCGIVDRVLSAACLYVLSYLVNIHCAVCYDVASVRRNNGHSFTRTEIFSCFSLVHMGMDGPHESPHKSGSFAL
jgi:hypothetical protein